MIFALLKVSPSSRDKKKKIPKALTTPFILKQTKKKSTSSVFWPKKPQKQKAKNKHDKARIDG